jgi:hypothetical protein
VKAILSALLAGLFVIATASAFAASTAQAAQGNIIVADDNTAQPSDQGSGSNQGGDQQQQKD